MGNGRSFVAGMLFVVGVVGIAVGVTYLAVPAHSLPSFFPGYIARGALAAGKHTERGYIALGVGIVLLVVALVLVGTTRRRRYRRRY